MNRRMYQKAPRKGRDTESLYKQSLYQEKKTAWINAHAEFTVQQYDAAMRVIAKECGV